YQQSAVATQRHGDGVVKGLGQDGLGKVGARQAGVLRLDPRQVSLPKRHAAEVQATQLATQQPQQVDYVARPITLFYVRAVAPTLQQQQQLLLRSVMPMFHLQLLEHWYADQALLSVSH